MASKHSKESCSEPREEEKENYFQNQEGLWLYHREWRFVQSQSSSSSKPKAILFFSHGYGEHCQRRDYDRLFKYLNEHEIQVYSFDHQGHGKSNGERVHVEKFENYILDFELLMKKKMNEFGESIPIFVMGHSMGSMISCELGLKLINDPKSSELKIDRFKGFILTGFPIKMDPSFDNESTREYLKGLCESQPKDPVPGMELDFNDNSRNQEAVLIYSQDPLVYKGGFKALQIYEFLLTCSHLQENIANFNLPVLFLQGGGDRIAPADSVQLFYNQIKSLDRNLLIYDEMYHDEILEDPTQTTSFLQIKDFIHSRS